jgi:hypothetical protein
MSKVAVLYATAVVLMTPSIKLQEILAWTPCEHNYMLCTCYNKRSITLSTTATTVSFRHTKST